MNQNFLEKIKVLGKDIHFKGNGRQIHWINCAKCMAILAVLTDHTLGILYNNIKIWYLSWYSVALFILISGMMTFDSIGRKNLSYWGGIKHSLSKIVPAYIVATFIYQFAYYRFFDMQEFVAHLIRFDATAPLYYVILYIQMMLCARPLYNILSSGNNWSNKKLAFFKDIIVGCVLIYIASICSQYSNILDIGYGGGCFAGKLLHSCFLYRDGNFKI